MPKCKGKTCNQEIVWALLMGGGKVPLDPRPPVYSIVEKKKLNGQVEIVVERDRNSMVSHFATCPDARQFSGKK
jgi:hypothetical protein